MATCDSIPFVRSIEPKIVERNNFRTLFILIVTSITENFPMNAIVLVIVVIGRKDEELAGSIDLERFFNIV